MGETIIPAERKVALNILSDSSVRCEFSGKDSVIVMNLIESSTVTGPLVDFNTDLLSCLNKGPLLSVWSSGLLYGT